MTSRRNFIQTSVFSMGIAAQAARNCSSMAHAEESLKPSKPQLALQLYSVRNEFAKDLNGTLSRVKSLGYDYVETAFLPEGINIRQAGAAITNAGLKVCSVHAELPDGEQKEIWLDMADCYNCKRMIWHGWPENELYKSVDGIKKIAEVYNATNAFAKSNGLNFGLHNHWWEFAPHSDGSLPMELLAQVIDKDIFFQLDTYWTKVAGQAPENIVSMFADRTLCMHLKDGEGKTTRDSMVAVGSGSQNFPAIIKASNGQVEWLIVELDRCDSDIFEALKNSRDYLVGKDLVTQS